MLIGGWDTNAGQRIGAASEIEGGVGPGTPKPKVPENLKALTVE